MLSIFITSLTATNVRHRYKGNVFLLFHSNMVTRARRCIRVNVHCLPGLGLALETSLSLLCVHRIPDRQVECDYLAIAAN
jgi:hypothetical protein